jgi:hypothetical protein
MRSGDRNGKEYIQHAGEPERRAVRYAPYVTRRTKRHITPIHDQPLHQEELNEQEEGIAAREQERGDLRSGRLIRRHRARLN